MTDIAEKLRASENLVRTYNGGDVALKKSLADLVKGQDPNNRYKNNYLEVIHDADGGYSLSINLLVAAAEHNLSMNKLHYYHNPLFLTTAIHDCMATYNAKSSELREFERRFNTVQTFRDKMRLYCQFLAAFPNYDAVLLSNPFIEQKYHTYYHQCGPEVLAKYNYDEQRIEKDVTLSAIVARCRQCFVVGRTYTASEVKALLQQIYDSLSLCKTATAAQLSDYLLVEQVQRTYPDGSRPRLYLIK